MPDSLAYPAQHDAIVDLLSASTLIPLVNDALRNCQSLLALSRSPLANSALVTPVLVKDDVTPTAEERGHGLRLVLQWAVEHLAPGPARYPYGVFRSLDDPTWNDPRWWRYNILRHRYLEPLHPDDFMGGGRLTTALIGLTGISSADAFYDERNRAINDVAERLRRQLLDGAGSRELQALAVTDALRPLDTQPQCVRLLEIAACFDEIFPREFLDELAAQEGIDRPGQVIDSAIARRVLLTGDGGANLWLSPPLRDHLYARLPQRETQRRHRMTATRYETQGRMLAAARHYGRARLDADAARLLLPAIDLWQQEMRTDELIALLQSLDTHRLSAGERYGVYLALSDLLHRSGMPDEALAACRHALQSSQTPDEQARIYRRMGKLYESRNQQHALRYYQQAIDRAAAGSPELAEALKDRGWLHFLRQDWQRAEADLLCALDVTQDDRRALLGAIYDAMANLYRKTSEHERAVSYAELALALREEDGDLLGVAKSHGNLGLLYRTVGDYANAIAAHTEAMSVYRRIGNQELIAAAMLNIGAACFLDCRPEDAIVHYRDSLEISRSLELSLLEIKAHYNLAEAFAALDRPDIAAEHWQIGYSLCRQHMFDDEGKDFVELQNSLALPVTASHGVPVRGDSMRDVLPHRAAQVEVLDAEETTVLQLAQREPKLTAQRIVEVLHVSRATATRRLAALAEKGYLRMEGKGRGAHYRLTSATAGPSVAGDLLDELANRLQVLMPELTTQHSVRTIGIASAADGVRLVVAFDTLPDLEQFFALEQSLCDKLARTVDLVPASAAPRSDVIRWLP